MLTALITLAFAGSAARGDRHLAGHTARTLNVTDTAHLRYIRETGSQLIEEGAATGGLPGSVKVRFNVGVSVSAYFTIQGRNGSLIGHGSGALHTSGAYSSFGGSMAVSRGTGRYAHAHGHGGFYGVIDRHNYNVTVQTTGTLSY